MTLKELAKKSDTMALNIMASRELTRDVEIHLSVLLSGTEEQQVALGSEIASRHSEAIPDTMKDRRAQAALVLRVAELIDDKKRRRLH